MSYLTLHHFGLPDNTFAKHLQTADLANVGIVVKGALANKSFASIIGPRGVGKSVAVAAALPPNAQVVTPLSMDRERLRIGAIEDAILYDLSNESPKRSAEARTRQIRPILGEAGKHGHVVLVIEEAHRLHAATLRALKSLLELKWMGRGPLLSVVLIGQKDPLDHPAMQEVALRAKDGRLVMAGLSESEAAAYIQGTVGKAWDGLAIAAAASAKYAGNFLDLREALVASMDQALAEGRRQVQVADVFHATGAGLREFLEIHHISQAQAAKAIGMDKSSFNRSLSGERPFPADKKPALDALIHQRYQEAAGNAGAAAPTQPTPLSPVHEVVGRQPLAAESPTKQAVGGVR